MRSLKETGYAALDITTVLVVGIIFAGLTVVAYLVWTLDDQLDFVNTAGHSDHWNSSSGNITDGFDDAINLIIVAITIFILAIAIAALLMLRGRRD